MFGPHWSEGQGLSKESPKEIRLEEDDADALHTILCVIHHRNNAVLQVITPLKFLKIAIATDKYVLGTALKYALAQWWQQPQGSIDITGMGYLVAAACALGDKEMFLRNTWALILDYKGSYSELLENEMINQVIAYKTVCECRYSSFDQFNHHPDFLRPSGGTAEPSASRSSRINVEGTSQNGLSRLQLE